MLNKLQTNNTVGKSIQVVVLVFGGIFVDGEILGKFVATGHNGIF